MMSELKLDSRIRLHDGNQMPLFGLGVWAAEPGRETYDAVVHALKTGYCHIDTAQMYGNEKDALEFYGRNLGLTFQIADDTLDYNAELKLFGKKIGQDFFEGKITLPIILLFQKLGNDEKKILSNMFKKELRTKDDFNEIIALINKYKIIQECYQKAQHYINLASNSLSVFKDSEEKNILKRLRTKFNDDLFIRTGTGMIPTQKTENMISDIQNALMLMQQSVDEPDEFNPVTSSRAFRISMGDAFE